MLGQRPDDYFVRERVDEELPGAAGTAALAAVGLDVPGEADPARPLRRRAAAARAGDRDGRPRRRAASPSGLICLDEPTRGLDRGRKEDLAAWIGELAGAGAGLLVATHDVEFASRFATRVVLLARGRLIADGSPEACSAAAGTSPPRRRGSPAVARSPRRPGRRCSSRVGVAGPTGRAGAMSWQAASLIVLAIAIGGGFAWFERSRPPARIVAAVAALAALGVAGRVVLAPIPNVVATTDVALLAGYALGGGPGFAVGALSGLVSNFWLGQGPWTPWQMAGWGLVGIGGAVLAKLSGRRLGRWQLALWAAAAGLAYGALLDLSVMVSYGGEQSIDRYLALSARGIPFNVAHAAGNFTLMLAAGPAMVRMLDRYRDRFDFAWRDGPLGRAALCAAVALAVGLPLLVPPAPMRRRGLPAQRRGCSAPRTRTAATEPTPRPNRASG